MVNTTEFKENLIQQLNINFTEPVEIQQVIQQKVNTEKDSLVFKFKESNIAPVIYFDDIYRYYNEHNQSLDETVEYLINRVEYAVRTKPKLPDLSINALKEHLYLTPMPISENQKMLEDIPHTIFHDDIALVPRYRMDDGISSFIVHNNLLTEIQLTESQVLEIARNNTLGEKYRITPLNEIIIENFISEGIPREEAETFLPEETPLYVITNTYGRDGSMALINNKALDECYNKVKELDNNMNILYIIPSSIQELICISDSIAHNIKDIKDMHEEIQQTMVDAKDRLTNVLYAYIGLEHRLVKADTLIKEKELNQAYNIDLDKTITKTRNR